MHQMSANRPPWPARAFQALVVGSLLLVVAACASILGSAPARELHFLNWKDYIAPETLEAFQRESGIRVTLHTFDSEEEMLASVQSRPDAYDVVIVSDTMVRTMAQLKLLAPIDRGRIPNHANVDKSYLGLNYDPQNQFSLPYLWGTTGLAINTKHIPEASGSWAILWYPAYKGRIAMLNEPQEVVGAALKLLGHSLNTRDPEHLAAAREKLLQQKPLLAGYLEPIAILQKLAREEVWAAQLYSGDALTAAQQNSHVIYLIPREGMSLWVDNLVVPVGARHKEAAEEFINYILRPQVGAAIANHLRYASPNRAARPLIRKDILEDPAIYPDPPTLGRAEFLQPLEGEASQEVNRIWAELQRP